MRLPGKIALVTGSSRGIGAEIATLFAREGARVIVNCNEDVEQANAVVRSVTESGGEAHLCVADVRQPSEAEKMISFAVDRYGRLDILVNNAGIARDVLVQRMTDDDWEQVIKTNLTGSFNCARAASKQMIHQECGRVINIASVVAEMGNVGQTNYIASKSGVIGLTKGLALELARYGILVNAIAPGFCLTRMVEAIPDKIKEKMLARIPMRRFAHPQEIAQIALFLASDDCTYMTGQVLSVNGGIHL